MEVTNEDLYLDFKKVYLMFKKDLISGIDEGDVESAEIYPQLEDCMSQVEEWYQRVNL